MSTACLRLGRYQDALTDVVCDALIVDAPYSDRTHTGHDDGAKDPHDDAERRSIAYEPWTSDDVCDFVESWAPRTRGWFVTLTDHTLAPVWSYMLEEAGRYVFSPLPFVETGSRVRLAGDGPSSWSCWLIVARPRSREFATWGTLPGAYIAPSDRQKTVVGGKPLGLMRAIVRDYSRPGDLVCDPCAGDATTLIAAVIEGRRAIGAEMDPQRYLDAQARIGRGYTPVFHGMEE